MARHRNPWVSLAWQSWGLGLEASSVMALRSMKLAAGGAAAEAEATRMIAEKVQAAMELQAKVMTGALGVTPPTMAARTMRHYGRKVRANRRRLTGA
jgi:hypothetical protein